MRFTTRKHRQTPAVIIVALIDILIVILIFLIVTTTFKQHPALKLALPESKQPRPGVSESVPIQVTITKEGSFYLGQTPVTLEKLKATLTAKEAQNPAVSVSIRADTDAPWGKIVNVMDAAKAANIKNVNALIHTAEAK